MSKITFLVTVDCVEATHEKIERLHHNLEWAIEHERQNGTLSQTLDDDDAIESPVTVESITVQADNLLANLAIADALTIDDDAIRHFNIIDDASDGDIYLDAGEYEFTYQEIKDAEKSGKTWYIKAQADEFDDNSNTFELTCEKVIAF